MFLPFSTSGLFWKLIDPRQLCFLLRTPKFKQLQILFWACKFQPEKLAEQHWEQAMEWLRKQQCVRCKEKGKKCSPAQSFPLQSVRLQQQVWEPGAKVAVLPCCKAMHTNALLGNDLGFSLVNNGPRYPQYSLELLLFLPSHEKLKPVAIGWKRWGKEQNKTCGLILQGV